MLTCAQKNILFCFFLSMQASPVFAQSVDFKAEAKLNFRDSENSRFAVNFPPGSAHETVDEGAHIEVSNIAFLWDVQFGDAFSLQTKVDAIDLYEKNPTSSDLDVSVDRFILRYGEKSLFPTVDHAFAWYAQIGKFGKFERQEDRHLESYGLVSTAFNRVEDSGIEIGLDLLSVFYGKFSYTSGNPVFFRDPNALAGDNGVRDAEYRPGLLVLYDAEVETFDLSEAPESGVAFGYRWVGNDRLKRFNVLFFGYQRDLQDSQDLKGTFYGADLDFFEFSELFTPGPIDPNNDLASVPLEDDEKSEYGFNLWWYGERASVFFQRVKQSVGGLDRDGTELELAYTFQPTK